MQLLLMLINIPLHCNFLNIEYSYAEDCNVFCKKLWVSKSSFIYLPVFYIFLYTCFMFLVVWWVNAKVVWWVNDALSSQVNLYVLVVTSGNANAANEPLTIGGVCAALQKYAHPWWWMNTWLYRHFGTF